MAVVLLQKRAPTVRSVEISYRFFGTVNCETVIFEPPWVIGREGETVGVDAVVSGIDANDVHVLAV